MPAVQSGNVMKVDAILNTLKGDQATHKIDGGMVEDLFGMTTCTCKILLKYS